MNLVDAQGIGIHQHQTKVGLMAADDAGLQPLGGVWTCGVERRNDGLAPGGDLAGVERRAFRMAEIATGDRDHALDIVQDAMMSLAKNYSHKSESDWGPLFHRILQSKIRDWYRRSRTRNSVFTWLRSFNHDGEHDRPDPIQQAADVASLSPVDSADNEQLMDVALNAIRRLPLRQQQAFLLRAWEGLDVSETARAMNCSQGSVKTHYSRATRALKKYLEAYSL